MYVKGGYGTLEQFNSIKQIATANLDEFSKKAALIELVQSGFSEEEAKAVISEMYFQDLLDGLEQGLEESTEEFEARKKELQRKVEFGTKALKSKAASIQKNAVEILNTLKQSLEESDAKQKQEATFLSNVDKTLSELPRTQTFELGKVNDHEIAPVQHEVSDESVKQVSEILKDPAKRQQFFYNQDNTLNLANIAPLLLNHFEMKRAVKNALLEGQTRQTAELEKTFPAKSAYELGLSGQSKNGSSEKGKVVAAGKRQVVRPQLP